MKITYLRVLSHMIANSIHGVTSTEPLYKNVDGTISLLINAPQTSLTANQISKSVHQVNLFGHSTVTLINLIQKTEFIRADVLRLTTITNVISMTTVTAIYKILIPSSVYPDTQARTTHAKKMAIM